MNEAKPIVTCHGNQTLFSSLRSAVSQGLPKEACEWRRSYGRAPRSLNLDASFVPYDADILPDEEEHMLVSRPYFHIFWTDCDIDSYKQTVKDEISEWQAALKARNISDWLIVVVNNDESKVKAKILRASVIDKVKSDFCGKYPERCIVLVEPSKLDSKSSESWQQLFQRLRSLLLQAFNRHLNKYEESMRSRREKRNEPGWNYFSYFIFQEELAFMLEMLGLKEDALIQYDELDAMFDQFVENFASGAASMKWLSPLMEPCKSWAGVSLAKSLDTDLRDEVKQNNASLLAFRNYLFSRQAALLFQMDKAWEVAMRALGYLYNTVVEMKSLEVEVPTGALACWVFLSCLEVLKACESHNTSQLDERFALYTANLWDFAHRKLRQLGHLCNLMPGLVPSSDQLSLVVDLVAGMGSDKMPTSSEKSPVDKLRESLSSPESFKRHYLELCEQAMGTYKYIGRFRSSRMIGLELAEFYMKIKEPQKAESFLIDSICMYQQESWQHLADGTMLKLAECQKLLEQPDRYLKTCCHIACSPHLSSTERDKYFDEMMFTFQEISDEEIEMRASQIIFVENIGVSTSSVSLNENIEVTMTLHSNFPQPVTFNSILISINKCTKEETTQFLQQHQQPQTMQKQQFVHKRHPSATHITLDKMANFQPVTKQLPSEIKCQATSTLQQGRIMSSGLTCDTAHQILKRSDSSTSTNNSLVVVKGDYSVSFSCTDVTLSPGLNTLTCVAQVKEHGVYKLGQMCLTIKALDLLKPLELFQTLFQVVSVEPGFSFKPKQSDEFVAGIVQEAVLTYICGSNPLKEPSPLSLSTCPYFSVTPLGEAGLTMEAVDAHASCHVPLQVYMSLKKDSGERQHSTVSVTVGESHQKLEQSIEFIHPFRVVHKVYTAGKQKYFQIVVHGRTSASFVLSQPKLDSPVCQDVELVLMNRPDQLWPVNEHQSVSLIWQMSCNLPVLSALDLSFTCSYSSSIDINLQPHQFDYACSIQDFQTQYILSYSVTSIEEDKECSTGETAVLDICVKQLVDLDLTEGEKLVYTVKANGTVWAIGGKSSGVFNMKEGKHHFVLDVVPMQAGLLYLPLVTLHKYMDHVEEEHTALDTDGHEDSDSDSAPLKASTDIKDRTVSQVSDSSTLSASLISSRLVEFSPGQVYNESRSRQIHVYPCKSTGAIDVSLVQ